LDWALPRGVSVLQRVGESKATVENRCEHKNGFDPAMEARETTRVGQLKAGSKLEVGLS
jgi:hypothetical protein